MKIVERLSGLFAMANLRAAFLHDPRVRLALREIKESYFGRFLNYPRRLCRALAATAPQLGMAVKWSIVSREDVNYTYPLKGVNLFYLASVLAYVTGENMTTVEGYINEARTDNNLSQHVVNLTRTGPYRNHADARCEFGRRLGWYALARILKPEIIVETGVDKGLGSVLLCSALIRNRRGRYYGTDINPKAGFLMQGAYSNVGTILYGDSIESLQKFGEKIDLFINDSDHSPTYELNEYKAIAKKLSPDGIVLGDNAHSSAILAEWSAKMGRHFIFWREEPAKHWYRGGGIGISLARHAPFAGFTD
jgi:predicted O-methyltransferase YrrM